MVGKAGSLQTRQPESPVTGKSCFRGPALSIPELQQRPSFDPPSKDAPQELQIASVLLTVASLPQGEQPWEQTGGLCNNATS